MKNLLPFLLLYFFSINCFSQELEELPEMPWANIVEMTMNTGSPISWGTDLKIKLVGSYLPEDSILVSEIIEVIDSITETISIGFSERERGNMEVFFIDSINASYEGFILTTFNKEGIIRNPLSNGYFNQDFKTYSRLYIEKSEIDKKVYSNVLKNRIVRELVGTTLKYQESYQFAKDRNSIFNPVQKYLYKPLNELDCAIITEVYKTNFKEKLEIAKKQFAPVIPWWLKVNPYQLLILPTGLLLILLVLFFIHLFKWVC